MNGYILYERTVDAYNEDDSRYNIDVGVFMSRAAAVEAAAKLRLDNINEYYWQLYERDMRRYPEVQKQYRINSVLFREGLYPVAPNEPVEPTQRVVTDIEDCEPWIQDRFTVDIEEIDIHVE